MKSRDDIKAAIDLVENDSCIVFHACEADKFKGEKEKLDHRFLLLTNISVLFFKIGSKPKQTNCEYWSDLVGVKGLVSRDSIITFFFKQDTFKFKIDDPQEIKTVRLKLGDLFQRIFTIEEQEMLKLYKSDLYQVSCRSIQNSFGQYSRFISYTKANKVEIDKETEKRFFKFLVYHQRDISIPKKIKSNEFESFMYGIDALSFVESISFKETNNIDIFRQLLAFYSTLFDSPSVFLENKKKSDQNATNFQFRMRDNIRHILFKKIKAMNSFDEFFYNLTNGQIENNLNGLSFENMKLIEKNFYSIDKFCRSLKSKKKNGNSSGMRSLSFNSTLSEEQYNYFISSFLNNDTTKHLCMLSLNNTYNLSMPLLLDKIRNIYSLSLADCNINIITTLQCINRARMENLRMLNLSGNFCSKNAPPSFRLDQNKRDRKKKKDSDMSYDAEKYNPNDDVEFDDDDFVFPPSLNVLYVRDVKWGLRFRSLVAFLKTASSFQPKTKNSNSTFHLSIRGIKGGTFESESEYNSSLNYFNEFNSYLAGFFTDVKKSYITHLDWSGNPVSSEFIEFLCKSKKLIELDVSYCFSSELEDDMRSNTKSDVKNPSANTLLGHFSDYLINNAKRLESLIICGRTKTNNDDDGKKKEGNGKYSTILSQNLSGNSIYPLFQAIKETKNPLKYINISGQKLSNPDGLNFFSEAIGSNPNIEKVSFKNTGFDAKEQFYYFVSKVKRNMPFFVEWPSEEMKNTSEFNVSRCKELLIRLSKQRFYYEEKSRRDSIVPDKPPKPIKKNRKSGEESESYSDESSDDSTEIKFDKLLFGKNYMARKIEGFRFDTEKKFPSYFSKEVEQLLSVPNIKDDDDSDDDDDNDNLKKNKKEDNLKKQQKKKDSESISGDDGDKNKKKNNKSNKKTKKNDHEESNDDSVEDKKKKKKDKNKKSTKKVKKNDSDSSGYSDNDDEEDDDDDEIDLKSKKKYLLAKSKKKKNVSDSDDDDDENLKKKSKKKPIKRSVSISSSSDYNDSDDEEEEDESDDNDEKFKFPSGIKPNKNSNKSIKEIKEKFSMENLMTNLVNGSD